MNLIQALAVVSGGGGGLLVATHFDTTAELFFVGLCGVLVATLLGASERLLQHRWSLDQAFEVGHRIGYRRGQRDESPFPVENNLR